MLCWDHKVAFVGIVAEFLCHNQGSQGSGGRTSDLAIEHSRLLAEWVVFKIQSFGCGLTIFKLGPFSPRG